MSEREIRQSFAGVAQIEDELLSFSAIERELHLTPLDAFFRSTKAKLKLAVSTYVAKGEADLRASDSPIENQWDGTCTAHSLRNVIDNLGKTQVSTRHIWSEYEEYSCEAALEAWLNKGCITSASAWPQKNKYPLVKNYLGSEHCHTYLKGATSIQNDITRMKESLDKGNPVYLGITVTKSMLNCATTLAPTSATINGGHALAIVGYKDDPAIRGGGYFIIKNSWGTDCADKGYQYVPYYYCKRRDMYCAMWTIDKVEN